MKKSQVISLVLFCMISVAANAESQYRQCMKSEMKKSLAAMGCDFSKLNGARYSAINTCGPKILDEVMADKSVQLGSDEFKAKIDILRRSGNGDIDEMANQQAEKCGVNLTIKGDQVTTTTKAAK